MVARLHLCGICKMNGESSTLAIAYKSFIIAIYLGQFEA